MKKLGIFILAFVVGISFATGVRTANAAHTWYFTATNTGDLVADQWFPVEIYFINEDNGDPDIGNDGRVNLNMYYLCLEFDTDLLEYGEQGVTAYIDHYHVPPGPPVPTQCWDGGWIPSQPAYNEPGLLRNIMGTEPMGYNHVYYPDDGIDPNSTPTGGEPYNHLATVWFKAKVSGSYDDLGIRWNNHDDPNNFFGKTDWVKHEDGFVEWLDNGLAKCAWQYLETEYWVGDGSNKAFLIVDFGDESFVFGYRWEGEKTVFDMLMDYHWFYEDADDLWVQFMQPGPYSNPVRGFVYKGIRSTTTAGFESQDEGENWIPGWNTARPLINGSWVGYSPLFPGPPAPPDIPAP